MRAYLLQRKSLSFAQKTLTGSLVKACRQVVASLNTQPRHTTAERHFVTSFGHNAYKMYDSSFFLRYANNKDFKMIKNH